MRGPVPADQFIGLAEDTADIAEPMRRALTTVVADQAELVDAGLRIALHVNLSGLLISDRSFCAWMTEQCVRASGPPIGLEITETAVITSPERAISNIRAFV